MKFNINEINTYNRKSIKDKYSIIASFGKVSTIGGFKKTFLDENVGIVASILRVKSGELNLNIVDDKIFKFCQIGEAVGRKYFVLNISLLGDFMFNDKYKNGNVVSLDINIFDLIAILRLKYIKNIEIPKDTSNISSKEFEDRIIVKIVEYLRLIEIERFKYDPYKFINEFDIIFVINDLNWSNFVYILNSFGITVFGGKSTHRHLLSTVQSNLTTFITLGFGFRFLNELIYDGFKKYEDIDKNFKKIEQKFMINLDHNESLLLATIEELKYKYGDLQTGIELHNVELNDYLYVTFKFLVIFFNKIVYTLDKLDTKISNTRVSLTYLSLLSKDQLSLSHYKSDILKIKESLLEIESLKQTYYLDLQNFIKQNVVKNINFNEGYCNIEPKIKLNIDKDCFIIDFAEFNKIYGSYINEIVVKES